MTENQKDNRLLTTFTVELYIDNNELAVDEDEMAEFNQLFLELLVNAVPGLLEEEPAPLTITAVLGDLA